MRRVVAGLSAGGRSTIVFDGEPSAWHLTSGEHRLTPLDHPPAQVGKDEILVGRVFPIDGFTPPARDRLDPDHAIVTLPVHGPFRTGFVQLGPGTTGRMHHTATYDVNVVVDGEMHLLLEEAETLLRVGDAVIVPGVQHCWRTDEHTGAIMFATVIPLG